MVDRGPAFSFGHLPNPKFSFIGSKDASEVFAKWSMEDGLKVQAFYFDRPFKVYLLNEFIEAFFGSPFVTSHFLRMTPGHRFDPIAVSAEVINFQSVPCTMTNTSMFTRLTSEGSSVARSSGAIKECIPSYVQLDSELHDPTCPIEVSDQLRKMVLTCLTNMKFNDEIDTYDDSDVEDDSEVFNETEKVEFLFRLFCHVVLGGTLCQYEDTVDPYVNVAKKLYKDLVSVSTAITNSNELVKVSGQGDGKKIAGESENEKKLVVSSVVVKVHCVKNESYGPENLLFYRPHINNFLYLVIHPEEQTVFTLYHHVV